MILEEMFENLFTIYYDLNPVPIKRNTEVKNNLTRAIFNLYKNEEETPDEIKFSIDQKKNNPFSFQIDEPKFKTSKQIDKTSTNNGFESARIIIETNNPINYEENEIIIPYIPFEHVSNTSGVFNNKQEFVQTLNNTYRQVLKDRGLDPNYSYILTAQDALESAWGNKISGSFNYGGVKSKKGTRKKTTEYINGEKTQIYDIFKNFSSIQDYCNYKVSLLSNSRYNAFNTIPSSNNPADFITHINNSGYSTTPNDKYVQSIMKIYETIKKLA